MKNNALLFILIIINSLILSCKSETKNENEDLDQVVEDLEFIEDSEISMQEVYEDISDKNKKTLNYNLNEDLSYKDILNSSEYDKLSRDKNYVEYIDKWWSTNLKFRKGHFSSMIEIKADTFIYGDKVNKNSEDDPLETAEKLKDFGQLLGKSLWKGAKGSKTAYAMLELEKDKEELYSSFSSKKRQIADDFEDKLLKIIEYSCDFPENPNVNENDLYQNFKSFNESLKNDEEVYEYLEPITENLEEFLLDNVELKEKLMINKILNNNNNQDNSKLANYGKEIIESNGNFEVNVENELLEDFYDELNEILNSLNSQDFEIPVEDWSDEKRENFNFIINDIKLRLEKETESLNL